VGPHLKVSVVKFYMAEFLGMITLLTVAFAGLRFLVGTPTAIVGIIIVSVPMHVIVCEVVERMTKSRSRHNRID